MSEPRFSVIMPAYNHAAYIGQAIESALAQTCQDFELIVVDDGSSDETPEVVMQYGDRVRYIGQENAGQGAARNTGINAARGEMIAFLDDDDAWLPEYLATAKSRFERYPEVDALYTGFSIMDVQGRLLPQVGMRVVSPDCMYDALVEGGWFPPLVVTVRRRCLDRVGPLDETFRGHDDWDLWLRIAKEHVFWGISDPLAHYRMHDRGMSADTDHMLSDRLRAIAKHFGEQDGEPVQWPVDRRRAYSSAYRRAASDRLEVADGPGAMLLLRQAAAIWPKILVQAETHYELACWDQPRGYRGQAETLDLERNAPLVLSGLEHLFAEGGEDLRRVRTGAFGQAYLAFAMLADQAGRWGLARSYLMRGIRHDPHLLLQHGVARRLAKLMAGQRLTRALRKPRATAVYDGERG